MSYWDRQRPRRHYGMLELLFLSFAFGTTDHTEYTEQSLKIDTVKILNIHDGKRRFLYEEEE